MFEIMGCRELAAVAERVAASGDAVAAVVSWEQVIGWAQANQLMAMTEVAAAAPAWIVTDEGRARFSDPEVAAAELAPELVVSPGSARMRVQLAVDVTERLPDSLAALQTGLITLQKLRTIEDQTSILDPALARRVEAAVLPVAGQLTTKQLEHVLRKEVIAVDPAAAEARRKKAIAGRHVRTVPLPDGMAGLWALLPAEKTVAVYTVIDSIARLATTPGDARGVDALRADTLYDVILHAHDQLTGRVPTGMLADILTTAPGAAEPIGDSGEPAGETVRRLQRSTRLWAIQVSVPVRTLTGQADDPAELPGYGPITAEAAREIAADATWQRILFDGVSGIVLDLGKTCYRPPRNMANYIRARDRTCRHPGCRQPAWRCELDHTARFPDGPTATCNLGALCKFHHDLKHHTRWTLAQDGAGVMTWTSPTGRVHVTYPWDYRTAPWLQQPPEQPITEHDLSESDPGEPDPAQGAMSTSR